MHLPWYVKSKTRIGNFIPVLGNSTSQTIWPFIFLSKKAYDDLKSDSPSPKYIAHLIHEETHLKRQKEIGPLIFYIKYLLNPSFRFNEELFANIEQIKVHKKHKVEYDIEKKAKTLSGYLYLWPTSYKNAKEKLEEAWNKA